MPDARTCLTSAVLAACLGAASARAAPAPVIVPPRPQHQVDAVYPLAAARAEPVVIELAVTVGAGGEVGDVAVLRGGDPAFEAAAIDAVRQWRFEPARRDGAPVAAKIRVPFSFLPPAEVSGAGGAVPGGSSGGGSGAGSGGAGGAGSGGSSVPAGSAGGAVAEGSGGGASGAGSGGSTGAAPGGGAGGGGAGGASGAVPGGSPGAAPGGGAGGGAGASGASGGAVAGASGAVPGGSPGGAPGGGAGGGAVAGGAGGASGEGGAGGAVPGASPGAPEPVLDVSARSRRPPPRAASDFVLDRDLLKTPPRQSAADLLSSAPGVYVARAEGEAVAHEIVLRGFDAAHGQDIEISAGALPLNQVSHLHGQGYADLNWVLPEVVRSVRVTEGVYDPRQGDFAVAGSIDFDLAVPQRGVQLRSTGGSFATFRQLVLWAPRGQAEETFAAAAVRRTTGFGRNRAALSGTAIGQFAFRAGEHTQGVVHVSAYAARAGLAGVLRRDDVAAGRVEFYGSYADPSANSQSAAAARGQAALDLTRRGEGGSATRVALWTALVDFHSRENFTGYTQRGMVMPDWVGRGDLIEQINRDFGGGLRLSHRTAAWRPARWLEASLELGAAARLHRIEQAQNLLQAPQNETWDRRVDAGILATDIGTYADLDVRLGKLVRVRGGARADVLHYDVDDRLGNFIAPYQVASHLIGHRRTATGVAAGPRASVEVTPVPWVRIFAAYGQGYRSPQARQLEEGERAPFAKVHSAEGGVRLSPWQGRLQVSAAGFATFLAQDLAFDPEEGRLEKIGPTRRAGMAVQVVARPLPWLLAAASVTYVQAVLRAPPPATAENPSPPFVPGQRLPYVPPVVVRGDLGVDKEVAQVRGRPLAVRVGAGYSYLSPRPLPYGQFADPVHLLDASAGLRYHVVELGVEAYNLLARRYAVTEYAFVSDWGSRPIPSLLPARHFAAGPPLSAMGTLTLHF